MTQTSLAWQSKLILLLVVPMVTVDVALRSLWWAGQELPVAVWALGLSLVLALATWNLRAATPAASATGAVITSNLIFSTLVVPYEPWHTALVPILAVSILAFGTTLVGRSRKERLGTAEERRGRSATQVAANLGVAAVVTGELGQTWVQQSSMVQSHWFAHGGLGQTLLFTAGLAALAEAAADTVSSEFGQVFGGRPRLITSFAAVEPGTDGAMSLAGTLAGVLAAGVVAGVGTMALRGDRTMFLAACAGGVVGFLLDSLIGATLELRGWLNNDAVNFLSTAGAASFTIVLLAFWR